MRDHGGEIDDTRFTEAILHGLPEEFAEFQKSYSVLKDADSTQAATLHEVTSRLQAFERCLAAKRAESKAREGAMATESTNDSFLQITIRFNRAMEERLTMLNTVGQVPGWVFVAFWTYIAACLSFDLVPVLTNRPEHYHGSFHLVSIAVGLLATTFVYSHHENIVLGVFERWACLFAVLTILYCLGTVRFCLLLSMFNFMLQHVIVEYLSVPRSRRRVR